MALRSDKLPEGLIRLECGWKTAALTPTDANSNPMKKAETEVGGLRAVARIQNAEREAPPRIGWNRGAGPMKFLSPQSTVRGPQSRTARSEFCVRYSSFLIARI